jgi:hypothetical protein
MKTFDDAVKMILKELETPKVWHGNYCRCIELKESRKLGIYCSELINEYVKGYLSTNEHYLVIDKDDLVIVSQMMIELGIAIGQEMEKE